MQGYICMMHGVKTTHKRKRTNNSNRGFFRVVTIDTTNKGSRPEIHDKTGRSWLDYRIFMHRVDPRDTTNKRFLLDTTNRGCLLTMTMKNFRRTDLLG
jgi:hypothetical protein